MNCDGAKALVTGAARRVGRAVALELASAGCDVAVHYGNSAREADEVVALIEECGRKAVAVRGDLTDAASPKRIVEAAVAALGGLDVLVNNAAVFDSDPEDGFDAGHWERTFQVNAFAPAALIDAAAEALAHGGAGKVVNFCDISADRPWKRYHAYCASKAALISLTQSYARLLAPRVQVNGVSPGIAIFPEDYDEALKAKLVERVPLKRAGTPEEMARMVRFLVEQGDYITGQIINVDGGRSIV